MQLMLMTIATLLLATADFELLLWNDGSAEVAINDSTRTLSKDEVRRLRDTLISPEVSRLLDEQ